MFETIASFFLSQFNNLTSQFALVNVFEIGIIAIVLLLVLRRKPEKIEEPPQVDDNEWLLALGEQDNIKAVSVRGSRLSVELVDDKKINRESLTTLGVKSIITMSNKLILVIENNANLIAEKISSHLSQNN